MPAASIKYEIAPEDQLFYTRLKTEVNAQVPLLNKKPLRRIAPMAKALFFLLSFLVSYIMVVSGRFTPAGTFLWGLLCGLSTIMIVFNISHDASHHCLFKSRKLNQLFSYTFYLVGGNAYLWNLTHNRNHHTYPNVGDTDPDIYQASPLIRSSPAAPYKPYHRYQSYYAPFLYLFHSLYLIYLKDLEDLHLLHKKEYSLPVKRHPLRAYLVTVFFKLFYLFYSLILPLLVLDIPWWTVLAGYLSIHFAMGALLTAVLAPVHLVEGNHFPEKGLEGRIHSSWVRHVFETTIDYSSGSRWANFFFGGLNTHLAHHLFPGVCHVHLREITQLIRNRAREYGMPYKELTMARALKAHFTLLSQLSRP